MTKSAAKPTNPTGSGHPISVVAERTGLSRDVLRVWERRYGAVEPMRTPGGQRLYSNEHIDRFRLLAAATRYGRNISVVAGLPTDALERLIAEDDSQRLVSVADSQPAHHDVVHLAMLHARALDAAALDRELRRAISKNGLPLFLQELVPTFMHRVGDEWQSGRLGIAHEHLASAVVLAIIFESMRAVPGVPSAPRLLVATPSEERHAVGAALAAAAAALDGWSVTYLGADVPAGDIVVAAEASDARAVALSVVHTDDPDYVVGELQALRASLGASVRVIVGGAAATRMAARLVMPGVIVCSSIADMRSVLSREVAPA